jgi:hypothetical protein
MTHQIMLNIPVAYAGSPELYQAVRAAFVSRGTTLNAWCKSNGINRQTADRSLRGERGGRRSVELRQRIIGDAFPSVA